MKKLIFVILVVMSATFVLAYSPTTTVVTAAWTKICDTGRLGQTTNVQFKVHNIGANPLTDCRVRSWVGPDATDYDDIDTGWFACISLAADGVTTWEIAGNSHEILIVEVKSAVGTSTYCRPYGN